MGMHEEGKEPGQLTEMDQGGVPYHVASCSTLKPGERRRTREISE